MLDCMSDLVIFCDGGSRGNPGKAAYGFVLYEVKQEFTELNSKTISEYVSLLEPDLQKGEYLGICTNNVAEWQGLLSALQMVTDTYGLNCRVKVFLDSELVVKQIKGVYKVKQPHLKPYFQQVSDLAKQLSLVEYFHVYREYNKLADAIVNQVLDDVRVG